MILVTGASGSAGGAVLNAVRSAQLPVRAMYRNAQDVTKAPSGVSTAVADYSDKSSLASALKGIEMAYIVCAPIPQLVDYEIAMIDACEGAGVRHVILNSALGVGDCKVSFPSWHAKVEARLQRSDLAYTILRPNGFFQNMVTYNSGTIRSQNVFYAALGDTKISLIDVRDVGAVAAAIFSKPEAHRNKIYELNGPEALSNSEIAVQLTRVAGRPVSYVDIPEDAQRGAMLGQGMPVWQVTAILELQAYYRTGHCAKVDGLVRTLIGHPERTLAQFLTENKEKFMPNEKTAGAKQ